ncbi:hypothetical protein HDU92_004983 [Lobulomyces angularis]|nr:hypothetical protein HDU92_004983 [Lobulomyces angularis]
MSEDNDYVMPTLNYSSDDDFDFVENGEHKVDTITPPTDEPDEVDSIEIIQEVTQVAEVNDINASGADLGAGNTAEILEVPLPKLSTDTIATDEIGIIDDVESSDLKSTSSIVEATPTSETPLIAKANFINLFHIRNKACLISWNYNYSKSQQVTSLKLLLSFISGVVLVLLNSIISTNDLAENVTEPAFTGFRTAHRFCFVKFQGSCINDRNFLVDVPQVQDKGLDDGCSLPYQRFFKISCINNRRTFENVNMGESWFGSKRLENFFHSLTEKTLKQNFDETLVAVNTGLELLKTKKDLLLKEFCKKEVTNDNGKVTGPHENNDPQLHKKGCQFFLTKSLKDTFNSTDRYIEE